MTAAVASVGPKGAGISNQAGVTRPWVQDKLEASDHAPVTAGRDPLFGSSFDVRGKPYHGPESFPRLRAPIKIKEGGVSFPSFDTMCIAYRQGSKRGYAYGRGVRTNGYKNAVLGKNEPSSTEAPPTHIGVHATSGGGREVAADPDEHELNSIAQRGAGRINANMYSISGGYQRVDPSREEAVSLGPYGFDTKKPGTSTLDGGWDAGMTNMHAPFQSTNPVGQDQMPPPDYGLREPRPIGASRKYGDRDAIWNPHSFRTEYTRNVPAGDVATDWGTAEERRAAPTDPRAQRRLAGQARRRRKGRALG